MCFLKLQALSVFSKCSFKFSQDRLSAFTDGESRRWCKNIYGVPTVCTHLLHVSQLKPWPYLGGAYYIGTIFTSEEMEAQREYFLRSNDQMTTDTRNVAPQNVRGGRGVRDFPDQPLHFPVGDTEA